MIDMFQRHKSAESAISCCTKLWNMLPLKSQNINCLVVIVGSNTKHMSVFTLLQACGAA